MTCADLTVGIIEINGDDFADFSRIFYFFYFDKMLAVSRGISADAFFNKQVYGIIAVGIYIIGQKLFFELFAVGIEKSETGFFRAVGNLIGHFRRFGTFAL